MDLRLEPDEEAFRERLLSWLSSVTPPEGLRDYGNTPTAADLAAAKAWQGMLFDQGWAGVHWPAEHGGLGAGIVEQAIFAEEMARARLPRQLNIVGLGLVGPMIIRFGTPDQQERFLGPLLRGRETWCQLFSEPEAGSDLAALRTTAVQDGDRWRVDGQKVWSSGAHYADHGLLLARTDTDAPKHRGITCFLVPMESPGIDVRPLEQMDREQKFNEVFMDGVMVEDSLRLGAPGDGWRIALSTLGTERLTLGSRAVVILDQLEELRPLIDESEGAVLDEWVRLWGRAYALRWTWLRALSSPHGESDPRMSVLKLIASEVEREVARLAFRSGGMPHDDGARERWRGRLLAGPGLTIAGGTSEIQRGIIAERVLGLPREGRR